MALETLIGPKPFVESRRYSRDREDVLRRLDPRSLDAPIVELIAAFNTLPFCFTLQSCYGHFIWRPGQDDHALEPVPREDCGPVRYRIAYVALCLENTAAGRTLHRSLEQMAADDPDYVQFGSAEWFWDRHANSYALQVEPVRYMQRDEALLDHAEALRVQERRDLLFENLGKLLRATVSYSLLRS
jgi:hypothetical protein